VDDDWSLETKSQVMMSDSVFLFNLKKKKY